MTDDGAIAELRKRIQELESSLEEFQRDWAVLRRKENVLHATLDSAADGILAVDEGGKIIFSNKQFARMWHIPPDLIDAGDDAELVQFVLDQVVDPDSFLAKLKELYSSFHESSDTLRFHDGRVFERHSRPLVVENSLAGRVWTFRDLRPEKSGRS